MRIEIRDLSKKYGDKSALDHLDMSLDAGIYGMLGPNGAGKSTLMNILVGNLAQSGGEILCEGQDIRKMGKEYRRLLGYMPQQQKIYPSFTGMEFLSYMAVLKEVPKERAKERICWAAEQVNLQNELGKKLHAYSGGMQQRILLAAAVLNEPSLLILDEPTAGLDPRERIRIRNLISSIAAERIVIIATHVVSDVECISNEIILMGAGKMIRKDSIASLTDEIRPYIYEIQADADEIMEVERKYQVSNILSDGHNAKMRVIAGHMPEKYQAVPAMPTLEDVYLYHFGGNEV